MRVTVLGKSPSWQDAGGACSGYLIEEGDTALLLDCGNGVFARLRERLAYTAVDAVVISHLHADHILDLVPFSYALTYGPSGGAVRPVLHAPVGAAATFGALASVWGSAGLITGAFDVREYDPDDVLAVGPLALRFQPVPHWVPTCAVEVVAPSGGRLTYGADCAPNAELTAFADGTDLLIAEATLLEPEEDGDRGHMTAGEAAVVGSRAGARRLVLTHISDELDHVAALAQARAAYEGPVEIAVAGTVFEL